MCITLEKRNVVQSNDPLVHLSENAWYFLSVHAPWLSSLWTRREWTQSLTRGSTEGKSHGHKRTFRPVILVGAVTSVIQWPWRWTFLHVYNSVFMFLANSMTFWFFKSKVLIYFAHDLVFLKRQIRVMLIAVILGVIVRKTLTTPIICCMQTRHTCGRVGMQKSQLSSSPVSP